MIEIMRVIFFVVLFGLAIQPTVSRETADTSDAAKTDVEAAERALFSEINRIRADRGLPAYKFSQRLYSNAKDHSRRMALDQKLEPINLDRLNEALAGTDPLSFWARMSGNVSRVEHMDSASRIIDGWLKKNETRTALLSNQYNRSAAAASVDRAGVIYVTLLSGEEIYQENNLSALEKKVFDLVNQTRTKKGLPPLALLEPLSRVAREHSRDMAANGYFSHTDLKGRSASARLRASGITGWRASGEIIASNQGHRDSAKSAVDGWLNSPQHAAIMLRPDFTHTGVGAAKALDQTYYFTQVFIKRLNK